MHDIVEINDRKVELVRDDIVLQTTDAIVNAANAALAGGGGVDGAIHRVGGPQIMAETRQRYPNGCPTGSAVLTGAGWLAARYVIHAVGPVWRGGTAGEAELLRSAYQACLRLADENQLQSIAFPSLSTGAFGYPIDQAAPIALQTVIDHLKGETSLQRVRFVLFDAPTLEAYQKVLDRLVTPSE